MKKLSILVSVAVAGLLMYSCGFFNYMANSIATQPEFQVKGDGSAEGIYNGQTFRAIKTGTCDYAWSSSDPSQLIVKTSGNDAYVTGRLKNAAQSAYPKLTARNAQIDSIAPVTHEVPVFAWTLKVYDAAGSLVKDPKALVRNNTYIIKMVKIGGSSSSPSYTPVAKLIGGLKISAGDETINLPFTLSNSSYTTISSTSTTYTIQTPAKAASCTVRATLGDFTESLAIATK